MVAQLKIAMIGAFDPHYTRHAVIQTGLERNGHSVTVMALPKNASTMQRINHLWRSSRALQEYDVILIPTFNQMTAPIAWFLIQVIIQKPLLMDYLVGLTDVEEDRQSSNEIKAKLYRFIDRFNIHNMTTFTDTAAHRDYFSQLLGIKTDHMHIIPVGVRESLLETPLTPPPDTFIVQYLGTFIPFHGVDVMLDAAKHLLDDSRIQFELIGKGQTYEQMYQRIESDKLTNVKLIHGFFQPPELIEMLSRASVFLGVFADSPKTRYVIPSKVFENVALGRPMITAESAALHECFTPDEHLLTVPAGDSQALAEAIRSLANSPKHAQKIGTSGAKHIQDNLLPQHIGAQIQVIIEHMLKA